MVFGLSRGDIGTYSNPMERLFFKDLSGQNSNAISVIDMKIWALSGQ